MTVGDTLLKITDYPFAYSLVSILLATKGTSIISDDGLVFIAIAGSLGTVLAITDPVGRLIKAYEIFAQKIAFDFYNDPNVEKTTTFKVLAKLNPSIRMKPKITKRWEDIESAFHTKAIELEKEKTVSSFYFLLLICIANYLITFTNIIEENLNEELQKIICDVSCTKFYSEWILFGTAIALAFVIAWNGSYVFPRTRIVATYLLAINSSYVTKDSVDALSRFIDTGDWKTAKYWKDIVEDEYLNEKGLEGERNERRKNHLNSLLAKFEQHKSGLENQNEKALMEYMHGEHFAKSYSFTEILQSFPYYRNLVEHAFTSKNTVKYEQIYKVFHLYKKWMDGLEATDSEKEKKIKEIFSKLKLRIDKQTDREILGENGQWINLELLYSHFDYFISTNRTELIPISEKENTSLHQVRIFDRRGHEDLGPDVLAELCQQDANTLKSELEKLSNELRQKNSELREIYSEYDHALKNLKQMIDEMILQYQLVTVPMDGSCQYCRNEEFTDKNTIEKDFEKVKQIPSLLFSAE